jgi:hypothetical protein
MLIDHRCLDVTMTRKMNDLLKRDTGLRQPTAERVSECMKRFLPSTLLTSERAVA